MNGSEVYRDAYTFYSLIFKMVATCLQNSAWLLNSKYIGELIGAVVVVAEHIVESGAG